MTDEKHIIEINIRDLLLGYDRNTGQRAEVNQIVILKHSFWDIINIIDINGRAKRIVVIPENQLKKSGDLSWNDDVCFVTKKLCNDADEIVICTHQDAFECLDKLL